MKPKNYSTLRTLLKEDKGLGKAYWEASQDWAGRKLAKKG